jgi:hypothetical protein
MAEPRDQGSIPSVSSRIGSTSSTGTSEISAAFYPIPEKVERQLPAPRARSQSRSQGRVVHRVHGRTEDYVYVTRNDLREIKTFGWLHQSLMGVGTFFFSGAFWLLIELLAHQEHVTFTAWMGMCLLSIAFGAALIVVGLCIFSLKQKKIDNYFEHEVKL